MRDRDDRLRRQREDDDPPPRARRPRRDDEEEPESRSSLPMVAAIGGGAIVLVVATAAACLFLLKPTPQPPPAPDRTAEEFRVKVVELTAAIERMKREAEAKDAAERLRLVAEARAKQKPPEGKKDPPPADPLSLPVEPLYITAPAGEPNLAVAKSEVGQVGEIAGYTQPKVRGNVVISAGGKYVVRLLVIEVLADHAMIIANEQHPSTERFVLRAPTAGAAEGRRIDIQETFKTKWFKVTGTTKRGGVTYYVIQPAYVKG